MTKSTQVVLTVAMLMLEGVPSHATNTIEQNTFNPLKSSCVNQEQLLKPVSHKQREQTLHFTPLEICDFDYNAFKDYICNHNGRVWGKLANLYATYTNWEDQKHLFPDISIVQVVNNLDRQTGRWMSLMGKAIEYQLTYSQLNKTYTGYAIFTDLKYYELTSDGQVVNADFRDRVPALKRLYRYAAEKRFENCRQFMKGTPFKDSYGNTTLIYTLQPTQEFRIDVTVVRKSEAECQNLLQGFNVQQVTQSK